MKLQLDKRLCKALREKINEINHFSYIKTAVFQCPSSKKGVQAEKDAFNCICAALDRIDDLVDYCNGLEINPSKDGVFDMCNLLNHGQILIDCISKIGSIYGVKYESANDSSSFHQKGDNNQGNDERYFKYLRSLCSVHPLQTTAYPEYQGNEPEWCPYISSGSNPALALMNTAYPELKGADFIARVYRNDLELSKHIPIRLKEVFHYLKKRYNFINKIIVGIDSFNKKTIQTFQNKHILLPSESDSYEMYLENLSREIQEREGTSFYIARKWAAIIKTHFTDQRTEADLNEYKSAMKISIQEVHKRLQNMDFLDDDSAFDLFSNIEGDELDGYWYENSKLEYLYPAGEMEDKEGCTYSFINAPLTFNVDRMKEILSALDEAKETGASHEELSDIGKYIDGRFGTNNSEWARIQLKIMEHIYAEYTTFDYLANDWHLYIQVELAKWLLAKGKEVTA